MFGTRKRLAALEAAVAAAKGVADSAQHAAASAQSAADRAHSLASGATARVKPTATFVMGKRPAWTDKAAPDSRWFVKGAGDTIREVFVQRGSYDEPNWELRREDEI